MLSFAFIVKNGSTLPNNSSNINENVPINVFFYSQSIVSTVSYNFEQSGPPVKCALSHTVHIVVDF